MGAKSVSDVMAALAATQATAKARRSRKGYFASLYLVLTERLIAEMDSNAFRDRSTIERLIVTFANRYLDALHKDEIHGNPRRCWRVAFRAAEADDLIILQHLLMAMNAHINFDLAVAVAEVVPDGRGLTDLRPDYDRVNEVLSNLLDEVQARIAVVSPLMHVLDDLGGRTDEAVAGFSIRRARAHAWETATLLQQLKAVSGVYDAYLAMHDAAVTGFARALANPLLNRTLQPIRVAESKDIPAIIDVIRGPAT